MASSPPLARQFAAEVHMTRTPRILMVATGLFIVAGAVAFGPLARAQSDSGPHGCSNRTLVGNATGSVGIRVD
jgi:hypothetical protein